MSKKANPTAIGGFVVGAVALITTGIIVFGGSNLLAPKDRFVLFFEGSVKGLNVGAPVNFRGVKIGSVTNIKVKFLAAKTDFLIPVYIELEGDRIEDIGQTEEEYEEAAFLQKLIDRGLRAQLQLQSFVTGQLQVTLALFPDTPVNLVGLDKKYREIPTIPNIFQELTQTLERLPLEEITRKAVNILQSVDKIVSSSDAQEFMPNLNTTVKDARTLINNVDGQVEPLIASIQGAADEIRVFLERAERDITRAQLITNLNETAKDIRVLAQNLNSQLKPVSTSLQRTLRTADGALAQMDTTFESVDGIVGEGTPMRHDLAKTLRDLSSAARSIRVLATSLERNPSAVLFGRRTADQR